MRGVVKMLANAALVVGGFFVVFFTTSKITGNPERAVSWGANDAGGIAYADAPSSTQSDSGDSAGDCAGSGDSGSDSGGSK